MAIFISYSHTDSDFVEKLALSLVEHNVHVWVDKWELNVGESILDRVQHAINESGALLIVLSKASVESNWCKKELNTGLMRELDESRVLVLPILLEDCEIPPFLREKKYADFRTDFDGALKDLVEALARVTNIDQGRLKAGNVYTDWAETWTYEDGLFQLEYTLIEFAADVPFTLLTVISVLCNDVATRRYRKYDEAGLGWLGRFMISETFADLASADDIKILLEDQRPKTAYRGIRDPKRGAEYEFRIRCQRLGEDNGRDQLINVSNYLRQIRDYMRRITRKPTPEEAAAVKAIVASSW